MTFQAAPCVGSGYCCKVAPCGYGERDPNTGWCIHLTPWPNDDLEVPRYRCGRYEFIRTQPGWEFSPAFGAGCSSTLFNNDRDAVLVALRAKAKAVTAQEATPTGANRTLSSPSAIEKLSLELPSRVV